MAEIFEEFAQQQMEGCSIFVFPNIYDIFFVVSASSKPFQTLFLRLIYCQLRQDSLHTSTNHILNTILEAYKYWKRTSTGSDRHCSETVCKHKQKQMLLFKEA